jgi:hypothetical protein
MGSSTAATEAIASLSIVLEICTYDITPTLATGIIFIAAKSTGSFLAIDMFFNISQTFRYSSISITQQLAKTMPAARDQNSSGLLTMMFGIVLIDLLGEPNEFDNYPKNRVLKAAFCFNRASYVSSPTIFP